MIIDCSTWKAEDYARDRRRVFVDGVEIHQVFYVDTDAGFVRTFDVLGDGGVTVVQASPVELRERGEREGWDMPYDGVFSKTIRGVVTLEPWPE